MHFGVVTFPGSSCEQDVIHALRFLGYQADYIWHQDTDLSGFDAVVLPGGASYGDYLRCGAIARYSPVMTSVVEFARAGHPVIGICNGFQILTEIRLLPGALLCNAGLKFISKSQSFRVEQNVCKWLNLAPGTVLQMPISHNYGNYTCSQATLAALQQNKQIVLRYCASGGASMPGGCAPNGALDDIAGICNERGNVFGLMPHPERVTDGFSDGQPREGAAFFTAIVTYAREVSGK